MPEPLRPRRRPGRTAGRPRRRSPAHVGPAVPLAGPGRQAARPSPRARGSRPAPPGGGSGPARSRRTAAACRRSAASARTAMPPSWARASTMSTPGRVGRPGKCPAKKASSPVSCQRPMAATPGSTETISLTNRNGGRWGRRSAGSTGRTLQGPRPAGQQLDDEGHVGQVVEHGVGRLGGRARRGQPSGRHQRAPHAAARAQARSLAESSTTQMSSSAQRSAPAAGPPAPGRWAPGALRSAWSLPKAPTAQDAATGRGRRSRA